jgi:hypothetical protein
VALGLADAGAVEETVEVTVLHPGSGGAPDHPEHRVEGGVGEGVVCAGSGEEII